MEEGGVKCVDREYNYILYVRESGESNMIKDKMIIRVGITISVQV